MSEGSTPEGSKKESMSGLDPERSMRLLEDVIENLPTGFTLYDAEGRLLMMSKSLIERAGAEEDHRSLIGLRREEVLLRLLPRIKLFDGKPVEATRAQAEAIAEGLWSLNNETVEIQLDDGHWRLLACYPTSEGGQAVISTEIHRAQACRSDLARERGPIPLHRRRQSLSGPGGRRRDLGNPVRKPGIGPALFGRPWPSRGVHTTSETYVDPDARAEVIADLKQHGAVDNRQMEMVASDGTKLWVSLSSRVVRYQGREVCVSSLVDLTESKRREDELTPGPGNRWRTPSNLSRRA